MKKGTLVVYSIGWGRNTTQLCGDYVINHEIRGSLLNNQYFTESIQPIFHITQKSYTIMRFLKGGTVDILQEWGILNVSPMDLVMISPKDVGMTPSIWQKWPHDPMFRSLQTSAPGKVLPQMGPVRWRRSRLEEAGCYFFWRVHPFPIFNRRYIFKWLVFHCHVSFRGGIYFLNGHGNCQLAPLQDLKTHLLPRNLTWNLKMMVSKRNLLFQVLLFRFHVKFQGCIHLTLASFVTIFGSAWWK